MKSSSRPMEKRNLPVRTVVWFFFWFFSLIYLEALLHWVAFHTFTGHFLYVLGFTIPFAAALTLLASFVPRQLSYAVTILLSLVLIILYGSQMVYQFVFGSLYSVSLIQQGGDAITSFWRETLLTIWNNLHLVLLVLLPLVILIVFHKFFRKWLKPTNYLCRTIMIVTALVFFIITLQCLQIGGTGYFSTHYFYHNNSTTIDQATNRFGLLTAFRLELFTADSNGNDISNDYYIPENTTQPIESPSVPDADTSAPPPDTSDAPVTVPTEPPIEYNVLDIDFNTLNGLTDNETIQALNGYFNSLVGTQKNEYTGMLADYNLIYICAESFSTAALDPDLTPTLYRLANQGIIFNNYYNTFPNVTTDGEYTMCLGLYPDGTRGKKDASFKASIENYLPYALGNIFTEQKGIETYGYHNYVGSYYSRKQTHANMGYTMKFMNAGMKFTTSWPSSDYEMMTQSVDDYITMEQFHAYYMTFSGHYVYDKETNLIAERNWEYVEDLDMPEACKAYLSCHIELEKAIAYLMERLEEAGIADKTAIVIAGDHFPYGLTNKQYSTLVGYTVDDFTKFKSSLIFWVGGMEENIIVDEYCCNADILPTVLNLWGFEYDSRMLAGTDVFSDGTHIAILRDYSFFTDKVWFNASSGKAQYLVDESELPENYLNNLVRLVQTKYSVSVDILNTDYYRFIYDNVRAEGPPDTE